MYLLKSKFILFFASMIIVFLLIGCSEQRASGQKTLQESDAHNIVKFDNKTVLSAYVLEIGENMKDIKKPHITYSNENSTELQTFVDAIKNAKKINGVVDVEKADYLLEISFEDETNSRYFLWLGLGTDAGSIMNEAETHIMYSLPPDIVEKLNKYVEINSFSRLPNSEKLSTILGF